jgi:DNA polymerase-3 subunit delta'
MNLVLHPSTTILVQRLERHLPQSLLLSGDAGVGLRTIAEHLAGADVLAVIEPTDSKDNVDHNRGTISIESIRRLYEQTRARQTRRQIVIIDDADRMSHGAQNAFLKLLEEPNEYIYFILTAHRPKQLLPTIRSRVQTVNILPVHDDQTADILRQLGVSDAKKRAQLTFIAAGLPAKLARLVGDDDYFADEAKAMGDARTFLQGTTFEKLALVSTYAASREKAIQLIDSSLMIVRRSVSGNPEPRFVHQLERLLSAREAIDANHHIKLQLAQIVL